MQNKEFINSMRPALIVGLGGTGQEVLVRIKARFLETFGQDALDVVKVAALDTRDERLSQTTETGQLVSLSRNTELLDIGSVPTVQVLQNLDTNFRQIKAWLPDNIPSQSIVAGAQQIRPLGRLAFFFHYTKIRDYLDNLIQNLSNINKQFVSGSVKAEEEPGLQIFLVSSVCGGTGSGIFLDTAYLLRAICERLGQPKIDMVGVLVLPQAFAQVPSNQIKANAYAALLELDQFSAGSMGDNFDVEYPGGDRIVQPTRPFKLCYLVDGINEDGRVLAGLAELAPMIAESIFLQISSQIGRQANSAFDNLKAIYDPNPHMDDEGLPHLTIYSGFGMSSLQFPAREIIDICGRRFAHRLVMQGLLAETSASERIRSEVTSFLDRHNLREDKLLDDVRRDDKGKLIVLRPDTLSMQAFMAIDDKQWPTQVQSRAQHYETHTLGDVLRKRIEDNTTALQQKLTVNLATDIARLLNDPLGGIPLIDPFLEAVRNSLTEITNHMNNRRSTLQDDLNKIDITTATRRLSNALQDWLDFVKRGRKTALQAVLTSYSQQFKFRFDIQRLDGAIQILSVFTNEIDEQRREIGILSDHLRYAANRFKQDDEEKTRQWDMMQDALNQIITDSDDLEELYSRHVTDVSQQLTRLTSDEIAGPIHSWRERYSSPEQISSMLLNFAMQVFSPIYRVELENEIISKRDEVDQVKRLDRLRSTSKPFWGINVARTPNGGNDIEQLMLVAVKNKEETIYKNELQLRGTVATTTLDHHRITVMQTKHGIPMSALARIDEYRRIYNQYLQRQSVPLHIFPKPDPKMARQMFALGEAFGFVQEEGVADYMMRLPMVDMDENLGKGLLVAVQRFSAKIEYVQRMQKAVEDHIVDVGKTTAGEMIATYTKLGISDNPERRKVQEELRRLTMDYKRQYL